MAIDAQGNQNPAVWAQATASFELSGALHGNNFASLVLVDAVGSFIHDATIDDTASTTRIIMLSTRPPRKPEVAP